MKKNKKKINFLKKNKFFIKKIFFSILIVTYFSIGTFKKENFTNLETKNPILFSSQTEDNLKKIIIDLIMSAKSSIFLRMYHINDLDIESALIKKAKENVIVNIICHDISKKSPLMQITEKTYPLYIKSKKILKSRKLMHIKALTIDEQLTLIGSANLTKQSLILDKNLMLGFQNKILSKSVINNTPCNIEANEQKISLKINPIQSYENISEIKNLILNAKKTIKIGMYVFTLTELMEAIQIAYNKGLDVEVIINNTHAHLTKKLIKKNNFQFPIFVKTFPYCLHHKFAWIDNEILIIGSANWTNYGFFFNDEYILYLNNLSQEQQKKLNRIWKELSFFKSPLKEQKEQQTIIQLFPWMEFLFHKTA